MTRISVAFAFIFTFVMFQNFDLVNARVISPIDFGDVRVTAPVKPAEAPSALATPDSSGNLNSVAGNWAGRQAHLMMGGTDDRLIATVNKQFERWFEDETPAATAHGPRGPAAASLNPDKGSALKPKSLRMTHLGELELGFKGNTRISCDFSNGGADLNFTRPLAQDVDLRLQHDTHASSVQLRLAW